ncbi:hypothetical protein BGW36DRAFT_422664 [Talaromyces proteolyticus]|uniref:Alpha/beta hydrolase fold-3 domain-containing protein n=1 Tax=Talaromyces proteolyticus TaxID=1131652 RepID=A0AAD4KX07_9EURO|nr:uncharacterized protein BGW36DRAFT_422664 [Talaromyces proteolyticus]KAH8703090.1 hypothetical protein BGW36DRAFT_422664 [Talaromyces proteolyticus]
MHLNTACVGASVTPTVVSTWFSHYLDRKSRHQKPTAHVSYDEGLHVVRAFLKHAALHTVEDIQAFTAQKIPTPHWVKIKEEVIPTDYLTKAAGSINAQLGERGITRVGGKTWWQWRGHQEDLKCEWIEMKSDYNARKQSRTRSKRVMFYVHGGAYFFGSIDTHRYMIQRHARKLKARVIARPILTESLASYRLSPQFPFPCGLQDCLAAYLYLLTIQDPSEIIVAGDSAGGGMLLSMLVVLRDQSLPLPAGAILISPWVDLTHSFPSVAAGSSLDYIPEHGFMHRPSSAWPPPNSDDLASIYKAATEGGRAGQAKSNGIGRKDQPSDQKTAIQGFAIKESISEEHRHAYPGLHSNLKPTNEEHIRTGKADTLVVPMGNNTTVEIKDQIQMYCPNQMLSHPLVSPVLQPSLGGLPPLLILTGGGELLRDEQIYLAHKAANPMSYLPMDAYLDEHDPDRILINKYEPTYVQLQVWDDLCHVSPTLSWTRPATFMFRSIAQFGAWALAHAQHEDIEIPNDYASSISSSSSFSESDEQQPKGSVGKAGDALPSFRKHMIRQRVDRHGVIYNLDAPHTIPALQQPREKVGSINPAIVSKWLGAKKSWDEKFAKQKLRVQRNRIKDFEKGYYGFDDEIPPACAIASRRMEKDIAPSKPRKSYGLMLWSLMVNKHDKEVVRKENKVDETTYATSTPDEGRGRGTDDTATEQTDSRHQDSLAGSRRNELSPLPNGEQSHSRSRSRSRIVSDRGQAIDTDQEKKLSANLVFHGPAQEQGNDVIVPVSMDSGSSPLILLPSPDTNHGSHQSSWLENASTKAVLDADGVISIKDNVSLRPDTLSLSSTDSVPRFAESSLFQKSLYRSDRSASTLADSVSHAPSTTIDDKGLASFPNASTTAVHHAPGILKGKKAIQSSTVEGPSANAGLRTVDGDANTNNVSHETGVITPKPISNDRDKEFPFNAQRPEMPDRDEFITAEE